MYGHNLQRANSITLNRNQYAQASSLPLTTDAPATGRYMALDAFTQLDARNLTPTAFGRHLRAQKRRYSYRDPYNQTQQSQFFAFEDEYGSLRTVDDPNGGGGILWLPREAMRRSLLARASPPVTIRTPPDLLVNEALAALNESFRATDEDSDVVRELVRALSEQNPAGDRFPRSSLEAQLQRSGVDYRDPIVAAVLDRCGGRNSALAVFGLDVVRRFVSETTIAIAAQVTEYLVGALLPLPDGVLQDAMDSGQTVLYGVIDFALMARWLFLSEARIDPLAVRYRLFTLEIEQLQASDANRLGNLYGTEFDARKLSNYRNRPPVDPFQNDSLLTEVKNIRDRFERDAEPELARARLAASDARREYEDAVAAGDGTQEMRQRIEALRRARTQALLAYNEAETRAALRSGTIAQIEEILDEVEHARTKYSVAAANLAETLQKVADLDRQFMAEIKQNGEDLDKAAKIDGIIEEIAQKRAESSAEGMAADRIVELAQEIEALQTQLLNLGSESAESIRLRVRLLFPEQKANYEAANSQLLSNQAAQDALKTSLLDDWRKARARLIDFVEEQLAQRYASSVVSRARLSRYRPAPLTDALYQSLLGIAAAGFVAHELEALRFPAIYSRAERFAETQRRFENARRDDALAAADELRRVERSLPRAELGQLRRFTETPTLTFLQTPGGATLDYGAADISTLFNTLRPRFRAVLVAAGVGVV